MARKIRFDWKSFRFVETVKKQSDVKVDHVAWNPETNGIALAYICKLEDVEIPVPLGQAIAALFKR